MPRKMPRGQRPGARRTIPARQAPSANTSTSTSRTDQGFAAERTAAATPLSQSRRPQAQAIPAKGPVDFAKEYHYVFDELKNVGILAGCMFVVLIVLSFIIH
jgi:hypothetical protein